MPRLRVLGSWVVPTGPVEQVHGQGKGRHVRGFVPWDGVTSQVETHGEVPINNKIFDNSGSSIITVKNGFSNLTKEEVGWDQQRKDIMNDCQGKSLKVAGMKENGLDKYSFKREE